MTTPKELADKAKAFSEKAEHLAASYFTQEEDLPEFEAPYREVRAKLNATIDQLQAMAEARQGSGEPVASVLGLTRDVNGMCVVTVNDREAIRDNGDIINHYTAIREFAPPSAQQVTGSGQVLTKALDLLKQATRYTCSREQWSSDLTEEIAVFLSEHAALAAATQAQSEATEHIDALALYKTVRDIVAEANAVDTVIGRPAVLMRKLLDLQERLGRLTGDIPVAAPTTGKREPVMREGCNYLCDAGSVCNKCGHVHGITGEQR
jgi:hypothetical protein